MKRLVSMVMATVLIATLLAGCGTSNNSVKSIKIGVSLYDQYDVFISQMMEDFNEYAKSKSAETGIAIEIDTYNADSNQATQNSQVGDMIADGCDILCINLVDRTAPSTIIDAAEDSNVPVIFFNRELVEEDLLRWDSLYYVGAKANESGMMEGELAAEYIEANPDTDKNGDGVIQYAVFEGEAGHQDAIVRTEYCVSAMEAADIVLEKVGGGIANWNRDQAKTKTLQLIEQGTNVEVIMCNNDAMALGVIDAYESAGINVDERPAIFGIDGVREGLEAVLNGTMAATVYNDKEGQAEEMLELAISILTGEENSDLDLIDGKYIRLPYTKVNRDNVEEFIK